MWLALLRSVGPSLPSTDMPSIVQTRNFDSAAVGVFDVMLPARLP